MGKSTEEIKRYYEKCFCKPESRYSRMMRDLIKDGYIDENSSVLDYGCGTGIVSHYIYQKYHCKVDAVDISHEVINGAEKTWKKDDIRWITMDQFDFPKQRYDLIISSQVIEHIHNVGNYLNVINYMLKQNGHLLIGTPNVITFGLLWRQMRLSSDSLEAWSKKMLKEYDKGMDHINAWDTYHFVTLLASCGFALEKFLPTEGVTIPRWRFFNVLPGYRKMGGIC